MYNYCDEPFSHIENLNKINHGDILFIKEKSGNFYPVYYLNGDIDSVIRYRPYPFNNIEKVPDNIIQRISGNTIKSVLVPNESYINLSKDSQKISNMFIKSVAIKSSPPNIITFLDFKSRVNSNSLLKLVTSVIRKIENEQPGIIFIGEKGWEVDKLHLEWVLDKAKIVSLNRYKNSNEDNSIFTKIKNFFK